MADDRKHEDQDKKKSGRRMLFVMIGVAIVAAGAGAGAMLLLGGSAEAEAATAAGVEALQDSTEMVVSFDTFVVNLADQRMDRFLKATVRAVVTDPELEELVNGDPLMRARTRDRIISILSSRTFSDVSSPTGKESLRREIATELNQLCSGDPVKEILFAEFVVQ